ncbi:MAG: DNA modification methylase [Alphaproteobacteria bacterium]|nr:DNA modification methylase [Alphaproteobacteria bacterium]
MNNASENLSNINSNLKFRTFKTVDLVEYERNPRKNDAVVDKMVGCIKEFGFRIPIVAKSDGTVVDGHLRLKAARKLGLTEVPVVIADDLSEAQIKAFRLIANQSANWAEWDEELLKLELEELKEMNFDLGLTGFDLDEISEILKTDESTSESNDEEPQKEIKIVSKLGDLWILGNHRLLCGNSTSESDVRKLMNDQLADVVFTDPPYNVKVSNISGINKEHKHAEFLMASGEMTEEEFIEFLSKIFHNLASFSKNGSLHYVCMDWKHVYEIITAGKKNYDALKQLCIWNKGVGGMGNFYRSQHELIFVFKNGKEEKPFHGNRSNVWNYPGMNSFATENRDELLASHPTVKSLPLVKDAILDASDEGDLVLDLFGGSGTTLIAAEETNRKCCMMELEPKYCDVIIRRWQQHDVASDNSLREGRKVIHATTGKTFEEISSERLAA